MITRTLLVSASRQSPVLDQLRRLLRSRLGFEKPEQVTLDRAETFGPDASSQLVTVVVTREHVEPIFEALRRAREAGVGYLLAVGPATDPKLILRAMQAGADLYLDQAELEAEFDSALSRLRTQGPAGSAAGRLFAVVSASGGCGASTLSVNLAALLAKAHGRCGLIDLNFGKADLASLLDLKPQYTIADLCRKEDRLDRTLYEKLLARHASGVALLAAPTRFEDIPTVGPAGVARAVALSREVFGDTVVDLEGCLREEESAVLEQATKVFLVCRSDFTAVRNTRRVLDHLATRYVPRERVEVVVNQAGRKHDLPVAEAEVAIGRNLTRFVPFDPDTISRAANAGHPAALDDTRTPVVQSIAELVGLDTPPERRRGLLSRVVARLSGTTGHPTRPLPNAPPAESSEPPTEGDRQANHEPVPAPPDRIDIRTCPV